MPTLPQPGGPRLTAPFRSQSPATRWDPDDAVLTVDVGHGIRRSVAFQNEASSPNVLRAPVANKMAFTQLPFELLGFRVMGDVDGITVYTDKLGRKINYKKAPPLEPASPAQRRLRDRFAAAVNAWKNLTDEEKANLELAVTRTSLCLTGQNLYVSCALRNATTVYETVESQSQTTLPALPSIQ